MISFRSGALALATLFVASCATTPLPLVRDVPTYDARTFYGTESIRGASFSADGSRLLVSSDASGIFNVYALEIATGQKSALTESTGDACFAVSWFPTDDRFLYRSDRGGNERTHLYVGELDGSVVDLTPGDETKAAFVGWDDEDRSFFVLTNERDPSTFDLYRVWTGGADGLGPDAGTLAADGYHRVRIWTNPGGYEVSDVSRDGRWVALTKVRNNADSDVYLVDASEPLAAPRHVTPHEGDISHSALDFDPDASGLYYSSNVDSEFDRVWRFDLTSGASELVFEAEWDVAGYRFSRDGRFLIVAINADARTRVRVFDTRDDTELEFPELPGGDVGQVSIERGGQRLAFYVDGDRSPANLQLFDVELARVRALTDALNPAISADDLVAAENVRYPSFDGLEIPALLYRPHPASAAAPVPALVWVHGGPGGQCRHGYRATIQHLVNHGYAVLAINNRGSSGYGKTFFHLDDRQHGDVDLKDCVWGRRYLESLPWVDGEKVGIIGGSYGGYLVCAALAFEPDAFEVGIDIFGVTNWIRTLESIPPWWADFRDGLYAEMGDPATDRERLEARSPLLHAQNIRKPLLVVQGANDPRVLQAESDELVAAVEANGVPVEYVLFEDEGHGFRNKDNRIEASESFVRFLDRYLKGAITGLAP